MVDVLASFTKSLSSRSDAAYAARLLMLQDCLFSVSHKSENAERNPSDFVVDVLAFFAKSLSSRSGAA